MPKAKKSKKARKPAKKIVKKAKKVMKKKVTKAAKKPAKKATKKIVAKKAEKGTPVGKVTHFYDRISVAVVELTKPLRVGDAIRLSHGEKAFTQRVMSLQIDHTPVPSAGKGQEVGMKVNKEAKEGTLVEVL
ncbi:MAG: hypothetical protein PHH13_00025 [Candidatus Peribacteraceae bacterium]|nr:hypothetical protein [Candidatus Peribacteraceae bacterium]